MSEEIKATPTKILAKLLAVMEAVDHIAKRGRNERQQYDYVKASDLYHAIRKEFIQQKIFMTTSVVDDSQWDAKTERNYILYRRVVFQVMLYDIESGESLGPLRGVGDGVDFGGDKSILKAQTGALKYIARNLFLLPDDTDPEADEKPSKKKSEGKSVPVSPAGEQTAAAEESAAVAGSTPALPSTEQKQDYGKRLKKLTNKNNFTDEEKSLVKAFILKTSKKSDLAQMTVMDYENALFELETHEDIRKLVGAKTVGT